MFANWIRKLFGWQASSDSPARRGAVRPGRASVKPSFDQLEDRMMPASLVNCAGSVLADVGHPISAADLPSHVHGADTIQGHATLASGVVLNSAAIKGIDFTHVKLFVPPVAPPFVFPPEIHNDQLGHGHGHFNDPFILPDLGGESDLHGVANLKGLGQVTVSGSIQSSGFIFSRSERGTLTFTNSHGSLTVSWEDREQPGFAPLPAPLPGALPDILRYKVVGGTGAYRHITGHGSLQLNFKVTSDPKNFSHQGTFTLSLSETSWSGAPGPTSTRPARGRGW